MMVLQKESACLKKTALQNDITNLIHPPLESVLQTTYVQKLFLKTPLIQEFRYCHNCFQSLKKRNTGNKRKNMNHR